MFKSVLVRRVKVWSRGFCDRKSEVCWVNGFGNFVQIWERVVFVIGMLEGLS